MNKKIIIAVASVLIIVIAVVLVLTLGNKNYSDKLSSEELYGLIENSYTSENGKKILDSDVILDFTDDDLSYLKDFTVAKDNHSQNINEIGIFRVENGAADDMKKIVDSYVKDKQQIYRSMDYFPEEVEKIDCATVKIFGNYVIYSFLNEKDTEAFYNAIENAIKE